MEPKTKEQQWVEDHPTVWWLWNKLTDFGWFFFKFCLCVLLYHLIYRL